MLMPDAISKTPFQAYPEFIFIKHQFRFSQLHVLLRDFISHNVLNHMTTHEMIDIIQVEHIQYIGFIRKILNNP